MSNSEACKLELPSNNPLSTNVLVKQSTSSDLETSRDEGKIESLTSHSSEQSLPSVGKAQQENPSNTVANATPSYSVQEQTSLDNARSVTDQQVTKSNHPIKCDKKPTAIPSRQLPNQTAHVEDKPTFENYDDSEFDNLIGEFENDTDFYKSFDVADDVVENRSSNQKRADVDKDDPDYVIDLDSSGDDDDEEGVGSRGKQGEGHVPTVREMAEDANTTDLFDPKITGLFCSIFELAQHTSVIELSN